MTYQSVFKRHEIKYMLTVRQAATLKLRMREYMTGDKYRNSTICNIYLDTPDWLLIRRSIEKPVYKEKLRLRSYGIAGKNTPVFCELKKKYDSIVYKRRLCLSEREFDAELAQSLPDTQIGREIAFCFSRYPMLKPKVFLSYEREAFHAQGDNTFRMTFDKNILWRDYDLSLAQGVYGNRILDYGKVLLEIKTAGAIPLWLAGFLSENKIYKTSFSKYGHAYLDMISGKAKGDRKSA